MGLAPSEQFLDVHPVDSSFTFVTYYLLVGFPQFGEVGYLFHEALALKVHFHKFAFDYLHVGLHSQYPSDAVLSLCGQPCAFADVFCVLSFITSVRDKKVVQKVGNLRLFLYLCK